MSSLGFSLAQGREGGRNRNRTRNDRKLPQQNRTDQDKRRNRNRKEERKKQIRTEDKTNGGHENRTDLIKYTVFKTQE